MMLPSRPLQRVCYSIVRAQSQSSSTRCAQRSLSTVKDDTIPSRPFRSVLYVPASNARALNKLSSLTGRSKPDAVMFDLEDGVGPDRKSEARENIVSFFAQEPESSFFKMIRVNRMDTPWFEDDALIASQIMGSSCDAVVLPKIEGLDDLEAASDHFQSLNTSHVPFSFWPMIETPKAILSAGAIASHPNVHGLILGTNDLGKELQLRPAISEGSLSSTFSIGSTSATSREGLITSLQMTILAARAHGKYVIDGVYNNFNDADGFYYECVQGKEFGMDGKTLIHPSQVVATNEIFAPSEHEVDYATRVVACWDEATSQESFSGVAVLDGALIELLHVKTARKILDMAERIREGENQ